MNITITSAKLETIYGKCDFCQKMREGFKFEITATLPPKNAEAKGIVCNECLDKQQQTQLVVNMILPLLARQLESKIVLGG